MTARLVIGRYDLYMALTGWHCAGYVQGSQLGSDVPSPSYQYQCLEAEAVSTVSDVSEVLWGRALDLPDTSALGRNISLPRVERFDDWYPSSHWRSTPTFENMGRIICPKICIEIVRVGGDGGIVLAIRQYRVSNSSP